MIGRAPSTVAAALLLLAAGCGDRDPIQNGSHARSDVGSSDTGTEPLVSAGPDGEMIPGIGPPRAAGTGSDIPAGATREDLVLASTRAIDQGRFFDAIAITDVMIVLDPTDAEAFGIRARAFELDGDPAGAEADRARCRDLGGGKRCR